MSLPDRYGYPATEKQLNEKLKEADDPTRSVLHYFYEQKLRALVADMRLAGYVATIELVPEQPLAMGNYRMVVDVRPGRWGAVQ